MLKKTFITPVAPMHSALMAVIVVFVFAHKTTAAEINITFTESLTNQTKWAYASNVRFNKDGKLYISEKDVLAITSAPFDFAITSLTVVAHFSSDKTSRQLWVEPCNHGSSKDLKRDITPQNGASEDTIGCSWSRNDRVQSIAFSINGSSGNVYLLSAKILGESIPESPVNLAATKVEGMRAYLTWENRGKTDSNKVYVYESTWLNESFKTVSSYTFNEYRNENKKIKSPEDFNERYPDFAGSTYIYLPTNSIGQIQISNSDNKGVLVHKGFDDCDSLYVDITARRYFDGKNDDLATMTIGYEENDGSTNTIATVDLKDSFNRKVIQIKGIPAKTPILFNATGRKEKHRIIVDNLAFIKDHVPEGEKLELAQEPICATKPPLTLLNLTRETDYLIRATSLNESGFESDPSEIRIKTTSENSLGFKIRIR